MPFLEKDDLTTVLYLEDIDTITEGKDERVTTAINTAIAEAKSSMDRYDTEVLFARTSIDRDPILVGHCVALAVWWLCKLCPANQNTEDITKGADTARSWLSLVQAGKRTPLNWPLKTAPGRDTFFHVSSYPKRTNNI